MSIPRRIIQTGKTRELSAFEKAAVTNLKLLHPDWEYRYFDDHDVRNLIATDFPQYQDTFARFPRTIQRIDFFRYLAVLKFGGFYFDLDVLLSEPLDNLTRHQAVFPFEELTLNRHLRTRCGIDWEIGNYAFGAAPGDPFLSTVVENCVKAQCDPSWLEPMMDGIPRWVRADFAVLNSTGPGLITRTLAENPALARNVTVLFPDDVCDEQNWHGFGRHGVHVMSGSWRTNGSLLRRRLTNLWETRQKAKWMPESIRLGPQRRATSTTAAAKPEPALT